jgi:hypothetical protein
MRIVLFGLVFALTLGSPAFGQSPEQTQTALPPDRTQAATQPAPEQPSLPQTLIWLAETFQASNLQGSFGGCTVGWSDNRTAVTVPLVRVSAGVADVAATKKRPAHYQVVLRTRDGSNAIRQTVANQSKKWFQELELFSLQHGANLDVSRHMTNRTTTAVSAVAIPVNRREFATRIATAFQRAADLCAADALVF